MGFLVRDYVRRLGGWLVPARSRRARFRDAWGRPGHRDGMLARHYFDLTRDPDSSLQVDDGTWGDLEFPAIFTCMNTAVTATGSQVLYRQLRTRVADPAVLQVRYATYAWLRAHRGMRETIQLELARMDREGGARVAGNLFGTPPTPGRFGRTLTCWAVVSIAIIVLAWPLSLPAALFVPVLAFNFFLTIANTGNVRWNMDALRACLGMVTACERVARLHVRCPAFPPLAELARERSSRRAFRRALPFTRAVIGMDAAHAPVIGELLSAVKALLLVDVLVANHAIRRFATVRDRLKASFELIGEIDAAIAVASWLEYAGTHCQPELVPAGPMAITRGRHPLLVDGVANSIEPGHKSVLVTGSNMAGKTTFIKMVGINMLLGQTLGVCLAEAARVPLGQVSASIQNRHSVAAGKSHYFAQINAVKMFLASCHVPRPRLLLIDEPFSGTNTVERIAIARAVLERLSRVACVFVTTHDVELQGYLGAAFNLYHFQENPEVDGFFDYRLYPGAAHERNAIRLLERVGFPADITQRAMELATTDTPSTP